jgi:adenylate cyclase
MSGVLDALNQSLHTQIDEPFRIGIGIHTGVAILGRIGAASGTGAGERITALGDTVNTASRLEGACKDLQVELIISADTLQAVGYPHDPGELQTIAIRGREAKVSVMAQKRALLLRAAATPAHWEPAPAA